jgi:hypothetical protein
MTRETVHAVYDYFDGPRSGVADFEGAPHFFECVDDATDDHVEEFVLTPLPAEVLPFVVEDWEIWLRWRAAHDAEKTTVDTHPALPEDRSRHQQLREILRPHLATNTAVSVRARAAFDDPRFGIGPTVVTWTRIGRDASVAAV